jgi:hypothetical protein
MDPVPRLVGEPAASRLDRADRDSQEETAADERHQDIRIGRDERPELDHRVAAIAQPIADRREQDVARQEPDTGEAQPAMGGHEPVRPEDLVEPRTARHQHELDEGDVGPIQGGELADRAEPAAERVELVQAAVMDPHPQDEDAIPDEDRQDVGRGDRPGSRERQRLPPGRRRPPSVRRGPPRARRDHVAGHPEMVGPIPETNLRLSGVRPTQLIRRRGPRRLRVPWWLPRRDAARSRPPGGRRR